MKTISFTIILALFFGTLPSSAFAASKSFDITATSSSFSPSSITVDSGDVVTLNFSVPSNDSYCCGIPLDTRGFFD